MSWLEGDVYSAACMHGIAASCLVRNDSSTEQQQGGDNIATMLRQLLIQVHDQCFLGTVSLWDE